MKPFILRSTTKKDLTCTASSEKGRRSQTDIWTLPDSVGAVDDILPTRTIAIATKASKRARKQAAVAPSRPQFVPDVDSPSSAGVQRRIAQTVADAQVEVEQKKIEMKRASVAARRRAAPTETGDSGSVRASSKWFATLAMAQGDSSTKSTPPKADIIAARRQVSLGDMTNSRHRLHEPDSPDASQLSSSSTSSLTIRPPKAQRRPMSPTQEYSTPPRVRPEAAVVRRKSSNTSLRGPAGLISRKDRYGSLSRARSIDLPGRGLRQREREEPAYSSMQEMLESSGFTDVRVITPVAAVRTASRASSAAVPIKRPIGLPHPLSSSIVGSLPFSESKCFGTPSSLAPPLSMQHKASMLSLRGLFSLWKTDGTAIAQSAANEEPSGDEDETSEVGSDDTVTLKRRQQFISHTQSWVDNVTREVATLSTSPAALLGQPRPPSHYPLDLSPRKASAETAISSRTVARRPSASHLRDTAHSRQSAIRTLRHVVSDPSMTSLARTSSPSVGILSSMQFGIAGYQSFALPTPSSPRIEYDDVEDEVDTLATTTTAEDTSSEEYASTMSLSPPAPSFWRTLKTRASRAVLEFGRPSTQVTTEPKVSRSSALPSSPRMDARPQLIRKAVSSVALRPVLSVESFDWDGSSRRRQ